MPHGRSFAHEGNNWPPIPDGHAMAAQDKGRGNISQGPETPETAISSSTHTLDSHLTTKLGETRAYALIVHRFTS